MKVILHNTETDLYFLGPNNMWTNDPAKAMDFEVADRAVKQAKESSLTGVEIIVAFTGSQSGPPLPVERISLQQQTGLFPGQSNRHSGA
jgi:hypothetical protein